MFTFNGRDAHRVLPASKIHLPFHRPIGDILPERQKTEDDDVWSIFYDKCAEKLISPVRTSITAFACPWSSGNLGKSICLVDTTGLTNRLGRAFKDAEPGFCHGRGISNAENTK